MATAGTTMNDLAGDGSVIKVTWNTLTSTNNVGAAIQFAQWADRSVQFIGNSTVFNGATAVWEGSNDDGTTWVTLTDPQGNAISKTAAGIEAVTEITQLARPNTSGGAGNQAITVSVILRRANPMRT